VCPQRAGAPQATLHFVKDEQRPMAIAQRTQSLEEGRLRQVHAPLPLHWLHDAGTGVVVDQRLSGGQVVVGAKAGTRDQRAEGVLVTGPRRQR